MTVPSRKFDTLLLPGVDRAAGHARRWLGDVLGADHPALDDASVCLSELVTNAVRYSASGPEGQVRVEVSHSERAVCVEVVDQGGAATVPRVAEADEMGVSGRGLLIVDSMADRWGVDRRGEGHGVWFELVISHHSRALTPEDSDGSSARRWSGAAALAGVRARCRVRHTRLTSTSVQVAR